MKKVIPILIFFLALFATSCKRVPMNKEYESKDTISISTENDIDTIHYYDDSSEIPFEETQMGINIMKEEESKQYSEEVEKVFADVISLLPDYKKLFVEEKSIWEKYHDAVSKVANHFDHGSSSPCYYIDVMDQSHTLRKLTLEKFLYHLQGKEVKFGKTRFTKKMIDTAYDTFIEAVAVDNDLYEFYEEPVLEQYRKYLTEERERWNSWMSYRSQVSSKLPADVRTIYDECTNMAMREKLWQVKNQNEALGVTGHEPIDCSLPHNCSDKALLEYPCFNVIWARHSADLDWYPKFD